MQFSRRDLLFATAATLVSGGVEAAEPQYRVLVVGDSQAQGLAAGLERQYRYDRAVRVVDRSRIGSGLAWMVRYNWPEKIGAIASAEKDAVAVVMFGANDRPPVRLHGTVDPKLYAAFAATYTAHVRDIIGALKENCRSVIWVGHPIVENKIYAEDMAMLNKIYKAACQSMDVYWFPSWPMFCSKNGGFSAYGKANDGETARLRADDGVHLTPAGYDVLARALLPVIDSYFSCRASPVAF